MKDRITARRKKRQENIWDGTEEEAGRESRAQQSWADTRCTETLKNVRQWQLRVERLTVRATDEEWEQQGSSRRMERNKMRKEQRCSESVRKLTAASPLGTGR